MSWHTVRFTMHRMAKGSTHWSSGAGIVFFLLSLSKDILSFDLQGSYKTFFTFLGKVTSVSICTIEGVKKYNVVIS